MPKLRGNDLSNKEPLDNDETSYKKRPDKEVMSGWAKNQQASRQQAAG